MLATRNSRWIAGAAGACLLLSVGTWFLLVGPKLDDAAALRDEAVSAQAQNDTLQTQIEQLKAQYADLPKKKAELAAVNKQFPAVAEVPTLLRKVNTLAGTAGVTVTSLSPGAATYVSGAAGASGAGAGGAAGATGSTGAADPNALVSIPVSMDVDGDYFQAAQFVKQLQTSMDRAFLITGVTVTQGGDAGAADGAGSGSSGSGSATSGRVGLQITGSIFALPDAAAAGTAGAAGGSAAAGSGTAVVNGSGTTTNGGTN